MALHLPNDAQILHSSDIDQVERQILQLAMARTGSRHGALFLWAERGESLYIDFHVVDGVEIPIRALVMQPQDDGREGVALHVARTNEPYLTNDTATCPHYIPYAFDVGAIAAVPIPYQGRAIGVITVSSTEREVPYGPEDVEILRRLARSSARFLRRAQLYRDGSRTGQRPVLIKGLSPEWLAVEEVIERVSPTDASVLIRGESGTGKELVAHAIHFNSKRAEGPFVAVNCAAIPAQLLESILFGHVRGAFTGAESAKTGEFQKASGGTLFLDELGELPAALQAKVLRALESGEVQPLGSSEAPECLDVRVLAATNRDLEAMRRQGRFRDDLYFRIAVVTVTVPPLRSYLQNLEALCHVFLQLANERYGREVRGFTPEALSRLRAHDYPGNVRELRNLVNHGVLMTRGDRVDAMSLPLSAATPALAIRRTGRKPTLAELRKQWVAEGERRYLKQLLETHGHDIPAVAREMGVHRATLYRLLQKHGLGRS